MAQLEWVARVDRDYSPYFQGVLWVNGHAVRVLLDGVRAEDKVELSIPTSCCGAHALHLRNTPCAACEDPAVLYEVTFPAGHTPDPGRLAHLLDLIGLDPLSAVIAQDKIRDLRWDWRRRMERRSPSEAERSLQARIRAGSGLLSG